MRSQLLRWPVERSTRSFRVIVVEPSNYQPEHHAALFSSILEAILAPEIERSDPYRGSESIKYPEFDLVTFPEAFLPVHDLAILLVSIAGRLERMGCVHVGLRSTDRPDSHLIGIVELAALVASVQTIENIDKSDLDPIRDWLGVQKPGARFNIGCVFSIDTHGKLRVCLHPKMVHSKFEVGAVADTDMVEGDLLSLITLLPDSKRFLSVTLQPLICSDALDLNPSVPGRTPLHAINGHDDIDLPDFMPDHIDIVSVAACTPQAVGRNADGIFRKWHEQFCKTFSAIGDGGTLYRHFHATVVLSNFLTIPTEPDALPHKSYGGLSGAFYPMPFSLNRLPAFAQLTAFGKTNDDPNNFWADPVNKPPSGFKTRGYVAHIKPEPENAVVAKLLGFTITNFPRDTPHWNPGGELSSFELRTAGLDPATNALIMTRGESDVTQ